METNFYSIMQLYLVKLKAMTIEVCAVDKNESVSATLPGNNERVC